jgi:DNA-binding IclR family transcriptional regulator
MRQRRARSSASPQATARTAPADTLRPKSGAQTLERALRVLRDIASSGALGRRLIDLQHSTGLTKPTAHRIAQALVRHDFATYDRKSRRYFLGAEISILSVSAPTDLPNLRELARDDMKMLAETTGDTAYLMVRSGNDVVCVAREIGPYPITALTGEIGTRRPLGVGAGGVALLAALPPDEMEAVLRANRNRLRSFPNASIRSIRNAIEDMRTKSYGFSNGLVVRDVCGIGVAIRDHRGHPVAGLSVAAVRARMTPSHTALVVQALQRARRALERKWRAHSKMHSRPIGRS